MGKATVIPQNTFEALQIEAGVLLNRFDPANPQILDGDIICATTGGFTVSCKPTYSDMGSDVDNVAPNMKELKHLDSWECTASTTGLGTSPELIKLALGAADIDANDSSKIIPRRDLAQTDFSSIWWVGDRADGGLVACQILNALSTDGFSLKTSKNGKGNTALTITGHVSIDAQDVVPMLFYSIDPEEAETLSIKLNKSTLVIADGDTETLTAKTDAGASVTWASTDTTVATVTSGGVITAKAKGVCVITAKASKNGEVAIASCNVTVTAASEG